METWDESKMQRVVDEESGHDVLIYERKVEPHGTVRDGVAVGTVQLPQTDVPGFLEFGRIALDRLPNTRDLGGMPTLDGRTIAPHRLIRSSDLHKLTEADANKLLEWHGLMRVVDLRSELERNTSPDNAAVLREVVFYDLPAVTAEEIGISRTGDLGQDIKAFISYNAAPADTMKDMYDRALLGDDGMQAYGAFLDVLLQADQGATLWHCTEGKDRAGLAAVLVEHILGVPDEYVVADYLATNLFVRTMAEGMLDALGRHGILRDLATDVDVLFYANTDFLEHGLSLVRDAYGSLDGYIERALDFGPDKQRRLREMYLI